MTLDLERQGILVFLAILGCGDISRVNCAEMAGDKRGLRV